MEFFEVVEKRRSVRKYTKTPVPDQVVEKALDAALLAPNSSNLQTWQFFWVSSEAKRTELAEACLNQNAARTARHLLVVVADRSRWKKIQQALLKKFREENALPLVFSYYEKLTPFLHGWAILAPIKWLLFNVMGLFKPMARRPWSRRDLDEISIKSAALAAENFMLAITAQGFDSCPMEGFDESRVKKSLGLKWPARVVMVVSVGERDPKGLWGDRYRVPKEWVVVKV